MRHEKEEPQCGRGNVVQGIAQNRPLNCEPLGTETIPALPKDPTDLTLRTLPAIGLVPGQGRHHTREGCETLTDDEFDNALSGFVLGDVILEDYRRAQLLNGRYDLIVRGILLAIEEEPISPGTLRGFAAYLVALIDGYAALAQVPSSTLEFRQ